MRQSDRVRLAWFAFAASLVAAWFFDAYAWMLGWYSKGLVGFFLLSCVLATWVLMESRRRLLALPIVGLGVVVANQGVLLMALAIAIWSVKGFAP